MRGGRWTCDADQSSQFSPPRSICFPRYEVVKLHTRELANRQRCRWNVLVIGRPNFPHPHRAWFAFEVVLPERVINSPVSNCLSGAYGPANLASHLISHFLFLYNWNTFQVPIVDSIIVSIFWLTLTNTESEMSTEQACLPRRKNENTLFKEINPCFWLLLLVLKTLPA